VTLKSYDFDLENIFLGLRQNLAWFSALVYSEKKHFSWKNINLKTMCEKLETTEY